eukprot:scaffold11206_cov140-Skeletonema_menzelii.AAC.2
MNLSMYHSSFGSIFLTPSHQRTKTTDLYAFFVCCCPELSVESWGRVYVPTPFRYRLSLHAAARGSPAVPLLYCGVVLCDDESSTCVGKVRGHT